MCVFDEADFNNRSFSNASLKNSVCLFCFVNKCHLNQQVPAQSQLYKPWTYNVKNVTFIFKYNILYIYVYVHIYIYIYIYKYI